jgi:LacI family transcriptional regulator
MSTMRDVAAYAGVSQKTVSRVFNQDRHVLPETRERVLAALHDLRYTPNILATGFRAGRLPVIAIAIPDILDPYFAAIARAADEIALQHGLSTIVTSLGDDPAHEQSIVESLLKLSPAGLILAPGSGDPEYLRMWADKVPIVFVDRAPSIAGFDSFTVDDVQGGVLATEHLLSHGHRTIAFVGNRTSLQTGAGRLRGYRTAHERAGVPVREDLIITDVLDDTRAQAAVRTLFAGDKSPTAVFSANAWSTMFLYPLIRRQDVSVISFGDFPMASVVDPALTVIDQDPVRIGSLAAERVVDRIERPARRFRRKTVLEVSLVERDSCRDVKSSIPAITSA